eukprot:CAMPEP_0183309598 /NCGR_PEP_ID=MMETSP0160_2-20130417/25440_1 /TAXON_ID=2839 ORGANISM="Odontella Sinensis, Strain Grunow 1884" /NCGR_SAMPLE_ID=MMETSP0160_2 /ASSEMBLY_ACC=CAM_ASM_000250 /LENGTH=84 /DNA_ID=CAMNT_0025473653 /DNA_START=125 /DNA_END=376 /DNA_ORIENTATION=-
MSVRFISPPFRGYKTATSSSATPTITAQLSRFSDEKARMKAKTDDRASSSVAGPTEIFPSARRLRSFVLRWRSRSPQGEGVMSR